MRNRELSGWTLGAIVTAGFFIVALLIVEILIDPLSWLVNRDAAASIRADLLVARKQWRSQEIMDYTVDVQGAVPLTCMVNATLSVKEDQLIAVNSHGSLLEEMAGYTTEGVPIEPERWDGICPYRDLLAPQMFGRIEQDLNRLDWSLEKLEVNFDPEYGYVTEYRYHGHYRRGILNPRCSNCNIWFSFSNFEPVTDP